MTQPTPAYTLFYAPGACSRVPLILLEKAGADYALQPVKLAAGEQRTPAFLQRNPKGQVPVLLHGERTVTENIAIASYLAALFPQAGLLPAAADVEAHVQALSWLSWCTATLHPTIFRTRMAARVARSEAAQQEVRAMAVETLAQQLRVAEPVLQSQRWLLGDQAWCAADAYLFWAATRAVDAGVDLAALPALQAHHERMGQEPAVQRALQREQQAAA
jgi:glutathione S-transferase